MRRLKLFTLCAALVSALTAGAQVLVTDAATELVDGTVIALQSRDYSAGSGYYFNGAHNKSATFSANNLFVVEGDAATGMKLRRLTDSKYIGKTGNTLTEVDLNENAVEFTAKSYKGGGFTLSTPAAEVDGTERELYVRFIATGNTFLNTRGINENPQYATGTAGYSVWYVYKFPECSSTISQASLSFERTGATVDDVQVSVNISGGGEGENGIEAIFETNNGLNNAEKIVSTVLCPNANIGNGLTASLKFTLTGLPEGFSFNQVLLDIHALDVNGNYHSTARYCTVTLSCGEGEGKKEWLTLDIKRGQNSGGFFFGLGGIKLIGEKASGSEENNNLEQTVAKMKIADVADLLASIKSGYERLGCDFPVLAEGVDAESVAWPQTLNNVFIGLSSNFDLLDYAQNAIDENTENLDAAKINLAEFFRICNKIYPVSVAYKAEECYGTLYMPFDVMPLPDGLKFWECMGREGIVLTLTDGGNSLAANRAYIVEVINENAIGKTVQYVDFSSSLSHGQEDSERSLLVGTHTDTTAPAGSYVLQNQDGVLGFYLVEEGTEITVPAGKCYLQLPDGETGGAEAVKYLLFPDGALTAVGAVDAAEPAGDAIYDLSGRRVGKAEKGLYIVGGRKVIVK